MYVSIIWIPTALSTYTDFGYNHINLYEIKGWIYAIPLETPMFSPPRFVNMGTVSTHFSDPYRRMACTTTQYNMPDVFTYATPLSIILLDCFQHLLVFSKFLYNADSSTLPKYLNSPTSSNGWSPTKKNVSSTLLIYSISSLSLLLSNPWWNLYFLGWVFYTRRHSTCISQCSHWGCGYIPSSGIATHNFQCRNPKWYPSSSAPHANPGNPYMFSDNIHDLI